MKQFNVENKTGKPQLIKVSIKDMKLLSGEVDFIEIKNDINPHEQEEKIAIQKPRHIIDSETDTEIIKPIIFKPEDIILIRMQFSGLLTGKGFKEEIKEYFDSKTDDTFKDVNSLISETLNFINNRENTYSRYHLIKKLVFRNTSKDNKYEIEFNPQEYFSANQFQAGIVDIQLSEKDVMIGMLEYGEVEITIPSDSHLTLTLF